MLPDNIVKELVALMKIVPALPKVGFIAEPPLFCVKEGRLIIDACKAILPPPEAL